MRPNLFPYAENAKPPFGNVSAVSTVNSPMVPVVASMGINFGAGLTSPFLSFLSVAFCAGRAPVAPDVACGVAGSSNLASDEKEDAASSAFLGILLVLDFAGFFAKPAATRSKRSVRRAPNRKINRIINSNLRQQIPIGSGHYSAKT